MLQLDTLAVRKIDPLLHASADNRLAEFLMVSILKAVARKLACHLIADSHEKSRNVVPKKIDELIVGDNDQNVGLASLQVLTQDGESSLGITPKFFLLFECGPVR